MTDGAQPMQLVIQKDGTTRFIYSDLLDLTCLGPTQIHRASHMEPDEQGSWWADLSPVGGPNLGPFGLRSQALAAEISWLQRHIISKS